MYKFRKLISDIGLVKIGYFMPNENTSQIEVYVSLKDQDTRTIRHTCKLVEDELKRAKEGMENL